MKAQFKILGGARAGQSETVAKSYIAVGRHPLSDLRFDAERDLDVSTRHAQLVWTDGRFVLRDLGSKNGTLVNGKRVDADQPLRSGDVIQFGAEGPSVEFAAILEPGDEAQAPATARASGGPQILRASVAGGGGAGGGGGGLGGADATPSAIGRRISVTQRVRIEVQRQTAALRRTTRVLLGALALVTLGFFYLQWRKQQQVDRLLFQIQQIEDSTRQVMRELSGQVAGLAEALNGAQRQANELRHQLEGGAADPVAIRRELADVQERQRALLNAAAVDYRRIAQANKDAVVLLVVEFSPSERFTGTGFATDSQGTIVTNKHVLTGDRFDRQPLRIAVKFSGSRQWFPGQFVGVSPSSDVGVLRVAVKGGTPRVFGFAHDPVDLEQGDPIAIIGFPLGFELPMRGENIQDVVADPSLFGGTVSKVIPGLLQIDTWAAPGSSGSPIFNRDGRVVGVLYGGAPGTGGRVIYGAPVAEVRSLLASVR